MIFNNKTVIITGGSEGVGAAAGGDDGDAVPELAAVAEAAVEVAHEAGAVLELRAQVQADQSLRAPVTQSFCSNQSAIRWAIKPRSNGVNIADHFGSLFAPAFPPPVKHSGAQIPQGNRILMSPSPSPASF